MFHFSRLVLVTAILIFSISTASAKKLTLKYFWDLIKGIPDNDVRVKAAILYKYGRYDTLENTLVTYLGGFLEEDLSGESEEVISLKRSILIDSIHDFLNEKKSEKGFQFNFEDESDEDSEDEDLLELIDNIPDASVKSEAIDLLMNKKFGELKNVLKDYLDRYIETLPDEEKEQLISHKDEYMNQIDRGVERIEAFENEEEPEAFEDEDEDEDEGYEPKDEDEPEQHKDKFEDEEKLEDSKGEDEPSEAEDIFKLIDIIPDESMKSEAIDLIMNKKFGQLKYTLKDYIDQYIETLPDEQKENTLSHKDVIKNKIDRGVERIEAFENEEEPQDSEDEEEEEPEEPEKSNDEEELGEDVEIALSKVMEENVKIKKLLSDLEDKHF